MKEMREKTAQALKGEMIGYNDSVLWSPVGEVERAAAERGYLVQRVCIWELPQRGHAAQLCHHVSPQVM